MLKRISSRIVYGITSKSTGNIEWE